MSSICRRCGFVVALSTGTIRAENKGLCGYCTEEYRNLIKSLDEQREEAFINHEREIGEKGEVTNR